MTPRRYPDCLSLKCLFESSRGTVAATASKSIVGGVARRRVRRHVRRANLSRVAFRNPGLENPAELFELAPDVAAVRNLGQPLVVKKTDSKFNWKLK